MKILGLTGGICCGKSTAAAVLRRLGAHVVDADAISRSLTSKDGPALPAIREAFGEGVFQPNGELDRKALAKRVFSDPDALSTLNAILHPLIRAEMSRQTEELRLQGAALTVLDVPLLFETGMENMADKVLCVTVPPEVQISRLRERDGLNREQALARMSAQMSSEEKAARSDFVLHTDRPYEETAQALERILGDWMGGIEA